MAALPLYFDTQFYTDAGAPAASYLLYTYESGTTTNKATYTDAGGLTANANPVVLNSAGRCAIWLDTGLYSFELKTPVGVLVKRWDSVSSQADLPSGFLSVASYSTTALGVAAAVSSGAKLYWPGTAKTEAATIPNFWNVGHFGSGTITRGSDVFYIDPSTGQTNNLYVATTGSDSNDGLSSSYPFATIQRAFDVTAEYAPCLPGRWVINIAAGTYTETLVFDSATRSEYPITIKGPTIGHPSVPTAIIQPDATSDTILTFAEGRGWFSLIDLKLTGATTGTALVLNGSVRVATSNVHITACLKGVTSQHGSMLAPAGGIWTGIAKGTAGGIGFTSQYAATHSFTGTGAGDGVQITAFERGMLINEGAQGHLDGAQISNCGIGIAFKRGAGECNTDSITIGTCDIGIEARQGWFNNGVTFSTGGSANTVNVRTLGNAPEYDFSTEDHTTKTERLVEQQFGLTHTGTTAETAFYEFADIRSWMISEAGHTFRVKMAIDCTATAGTCTFRAYIFDGSTEDFLSSVVLPINTTSAVVEHLITVSNVNAQRSISTAIHNAGALCGAYGTGAMNMLNSGGRIRVKIQLSDAADTVNARWLEFYSTIGG